MGRFRPEDCAIDRATDRHGIHEVAGPLLAGGISLIGWRTGLLNEDEVRHALTDERRFRAHLEFRERAFRLAAPVLYGAAKSPVHLFRLIDSDGDHFDMVEHIMIRHIRHDGSSSLLPGSIIRDIENDQEMLYAGWGDAQRYFACWKLLMKLDFIQPDSDVEDVLEKLKSSTRWPGLKHDSDLRRCLEGYMYFLKDYEKSRMGTPSSISEYENAALEKINSELSSSLHDHDCRSQDQEMLYAGWGDAQRYFACWKLLMKLDFIQPDSDVEDVLEKLKSSTRWPGLKHDSDLRRCLEGYMYFLKDYEKSRMGTPSSISEYENAALEKINSELSSSLHDHDCRSQDQEMLYAGWGDAQRYFACWKLLMKLDFIQPDSDVEDVLEKLKSSTRWPGLKHDSDLRRCLEGYMYFLKDYEKSRMGTPSSISEYENAALEKINSELSSSLHDHDCRSQDQEMLYAGWGDAQRYFACWKLLMKLDFIQPDSDVEDVLEKLKSSTRWPGLKHDSDLRRCLEGYMYFLKDYEKSRMGTPSSISEYENAALEKINSELSSSLHDHDCRSQDQEMLYAGWGDAQRYFACWKLLMKLDFIQPDSDVEDVLEKLKSSTRWPGLKHDSDLRRCLEGYMYFLKDYEKSRMGTPSSISEYENAALEKINSELSSSLHDHDCRSQDQEMLYAGWGDAQRYFACWKLLMKLDFIQPDSDVEDVLEKLKSSTRWPGLKHDSDLRRCLEGYMYFLKDYEKSRMGTPSSISEYENAALEKINSELSSSLHDHDCRSQDQEMLYAGWGDAQRYFACWKLLMKLDFIQPDSDVEDVLEKLKSSTRWPGLKHDSDLRRCLEGYMYFLKDYEKSRMGTPSSISEYENAALEKINSELSSSLHDHDCRSQDQEMLYAGWGDAQRYFACWKLLMKLDFIQPDSDVEDVLEKLKSSTRWPGLKHDSDLRRCLEGYMYFLKDYEKSRMGTPSSISEYENAALEKINSELSSSLHDHDCRSQDQEMLYAGWGDAQRYFACWKLLMKLDFIQPDSDVEDVLEKLKSSTRWPGLKHDSDLRRCLEGYMYFLKDYEKSRMGTPSSISEYENAALEKINSELSSSLHDHDCRSQDQEMLYAGWGDAQRYFACWKLLMKLDFIQPDSDVEDVLEKLKSSTRWPGLKHDSDLRRCLEGYMYFLKDYEKSRMGTPSSISEYENAALEKINSELSSSLHDHDCRSQDQEMLYAGWGDAQRYFACWKLLMKLDFIQPDSDVEDVLEKLKSSTRWPGLKHDSGLRRCLEGYMYFLKDYEKSRMGTPSSVTKYENAALEKINSELSSSLHDHLDDYDCTLMDQYYDRAKLRQLARECATQAQTIGVILVGEALPINPQVRTLPLIKRIQGRFRSGAASRRPWQLLAALATLATVTTAGGLGGMLRLDSERSHG